MCIGYRPATGGAQQLPFMQRYNELNPDEPRMRKD